MAETDIELSVGLSAQDVKKSAQELSGAVKDIFEKSAGASLTPKMQKLQQQMSQTTAKAEVLSRKMRELEQVKMPTQEYQEVKKQIEQAEAKLNKLREQEEKFAETGKKISPQKLKEMQYEAAQLENTIEYAKGELQDLVDTGQAFTLGSDTAQYEKLANDLAGVNNQSRILINNWDNLVMSEKSSINVSKLLSTVWRNTVSTFKQLTNVIKKLASGLRSAVSHLRSFASAAKSANRGGMDFNKGLKKGLMMVLKYGFGIRSLYFLFRKLRAAMADGIKNVVLWEGENGRLNKSISSLMSALSTLKNSIGAMVAPLINSLAPAITKIIDLINVAIQKISMFVAALTGQKTFLTANKVQENYAASLDKTGKSAKKAAKELKGYLSPLDEINKFQKKDEDDGGGAGGGAGAGFTETPVDPKMLDLIEKLKKMWDDKDFTKLGTELGQRLKKALDSIPWDEIRKTSNDLGKCLATLINGFVEVQGLGYSIGTTVAQSVNTVFEFINGFVHNLHWDSIGKFIADTFNGFFENIDWDLIKDTIITGIQGIVDAVNTFISEFHWDNISNTISNGINIIAGAIYTFFKGIKWDELGKNLGDQLMKSIKQINWKQIGQALGSILQAVITFVHNFIKQLKVEDIRKALKDLVDGFFDEVDSQELGETIAQIINLAIDVAKGFWADNKDTLKEEGGKLLKGFFENVDKADLISVISGVLTVVVVGGIAKSIPKILADTVVKGFGKKLVEDGLFKNLGTFLSGITSTIGTWLTADVGATVASGGAAAGGMIASSIVAAIVAFFGGAELGKKLGAWIFPEDKDLYEHYSGIKGTFELLKDTVVTLGERTAEHLGNAWDNVNEAGRTMAERTGEHFQNLKEKAQTSIENVKTAISTFKDRTAEKIDGIKSKLEEGGVKFTSFGAGVGVSVEGVQTKVQEKLENIKTRFGELATTVGDKKTDISNKIHEMKNKAAENFENMKSKAENLKTDWSNKFSTIKSNIDTFKNNASTSFNNVKGVVDTFKSNTGSILNTIQGNIDTFKNNWKSRFNDIKSNTESFKSSVSSAFEGIKSTVINTVQGIANGIKSPINSVLTSIEKMVNGIVDGINAMGDKLGSFDFEIPDWVPGDLGGKKFDLSLPKLNHVSIPRLAQGAVIPPNKEFLATLGDQKSGVNIETPLSTMVDAFKQAMRETGNGVGKVVLQIVTPDKQTLAEYVVEGGKVTQMSTGRNIFELAGV